MKRFYTDLRPRIADVAPQGFYADCSADEKCGVLLIEDLSAEQVELFHSTRPMAIVDAAAVVRALAKIHLPFYANGALAAQQRLVPPVQARNAYRVHTVEPAFLKSWLSAPPAAEFPAFLADPLRLSGILKSMAERLPTDVSGLLHGDAHVGNCYRRRGGDGSFYDRQRVVRGPHLFDIVCFLASALDAGIRRLEERNLLSEYLGVLNAGATGLAFDDAWRGSRRYARYGLWAWLTNPPLFHAEPVNVNVSNRFAQAVADIEGCAGIEGWT